MAAADLKCYKALLVLVNTLFFLCGIALIVVGSLTVAGDVLALSNDNLGAGLIVLGVLVFFVSLIGCLGALKSNRGLLKLYFGLTLLILLIQLVLAIVGYVYRDDVPQFTADAWDDAPDSTRDAIQQQFECCGWVYLSDKPAPPTCVEPNYTYTEPCQHKVQEAIQNNYGAIAGTAVAVAVFQILILIFTCCLIQRIPTKQQQEQALLEEARQSGREADPTAQTARYGSYA